MPERCVGIVVEGGRVIVVDADIPDDPDKPIVVQHADKWNLQAGDQAGAYAFMWKRCVNHIRERGVSRAFVKASSATRNAATKALLASAELRGVIIAAAASEVPVSQMAKEHISKHYGDQTFDEYCKDDQFWDEHTTGGDLKKYCRPAAMVLIAGRAKP